MSAANAQRSRYLKSKDLLLAGCAFAATLGHAYVIFTQFVMFECRTWALNLVFVG